LGVVDIEFHAAGAGDRHGVEQHIGNGRFRYGPKDSRSLCPARRGSRDVAEGDVVPIGRRAGGSRRRIRRGRQVVRIPAGEIEGIIDDIGHG
jgi:hypothetical protein